MKALDRADPEEGTAHGLRLILKGMYSDEKVPSQQVIEQSLDVLAHPSIGVVDEADGQYDLTTSPEAAWTVLERFGTLIADIDET